MSFDSVRFRFRLVPTAMVVFGVPLFVGLGFWQLDRADQKRQMAKQTEQANRLPPMQINALLDLQSGERYRKVWVDGRYLPGEQVFLENRKHRGKNGYHVITPLRIEGSDSVVLVNRGWIPMPEDPAMDPQVETPKGSVRVSGVIDYPSPPAIALHDGSTAPDDWGRRWPYLTVALFGSRIAAPLQPFVILQDAGDAHGFVRHWPRLPPKETMHLGYAIQWFAFAVIALAIWLRLSLERLPEHAARRGP